MLILIVSSDIRSLVHSLYSFFYTTSGFLIFALNWDKLGMNNFDLFLLVMICCISSKNFHSLLISGLLFKFKKLTWCFVFEVLFDWSLFDWTVVASATSELSSTAVRSFSVSSPSSHSCWNSSKDISSPSQSRSSLPSTFAFRLTHLRGITLRITYFKVLTKFCYINSFQKSIISSPISVNNLSDTK